jgi:hypothetical protein
MSKQAAKRISREQRGQSNRAIGVGEVHSVTESAAPVTDVRWERAKAVHAAAKAAGASDREAYDAAQAAYEAA